MSEFDKLMEELDTLQKSYGADEGEGEDDKNIAAAASDGDEDPDNDDDDDDDDDKQGDKDDDFEPMEKSFKFELDNGETVEAIDATKLVKGLQKRLADAEARLTKSFQDNESAGIKVSGKILDLLKSQAAEIASLKDKVASFGNEGRGRKAVLTVHDGGLAAPTQKTLESAKTELLAKASAAFDQGRITGRELTETDVALRRNEVPSQEILAKLA